MDKVPRIVWIAIAFNFTGMGLLSLSLFANSPLQFLLTFAFGSVCLSAGLIVWAVMVVREARAKGLFE